MRRPIAVIVWLTLAGPAGAADEPKAPPVKEPELRAELLRRRRPIRRSAARSPG